MIKVSVMYPNTPGARFDHAYYRDAHMPMIKRLLGDGCLYYTVDKGLSGAEPGSAPLYVAMCHIFCNSVADLQVLGEHGADIAADIAKYTDIAPLQQISEVVVEKGTV